MKVSDFWDILYIFYFIGLCFCLWKAFDRIEKLEAIINNGYCLKEKQELKGKK